VGLNLAQYHNLCRFYIKFIKLKQNVDTVCIRQYASCLELIKRFC
jgi:hypothetical protein